MKLAQHNEATLDAMFGRSAPARLGPVAVSLGGRGSAVRLRASAAIGMFAAIGIGTSL